MGITIRKLSVDDPIVVDLVRGHRAYTAAYTPEGSGHAVEPEALQTADDLSYWVAFDGETPAGCVALKCLSSEHGEIKTMHTLPEHRGKGIAQTLLGHLEGEAKGMGLTRLSLETGKSDAFAASRRLYERCGFVPSAPFGDYVDDPFSYCMTKVI